MTASPFLLVQIGKSPIQSPTSDFARYLLYTFARRRVPKIPGIAVDPECPYMYDALNFLFYCNSREIDLPLALRARWLMFCLKILSHIAARCRFLLGGSEVIPTSVTAMVAVWADSRREAEENVFEGSARTRYVALFAVNGGHACSLDTFVFTTVFISIKLLLSMLFIIKKSIVTQLYC